MWKHYVALVSIIYFINSLIICDASRIKRKQKVCVIGAGPAGLTSAKHLSEHSNEFNIVVFERSPDLGGVWLYNDRTIDEYDLPVHSAMYKNLRTNTPKLLMHFRDYPPTYGKDRDCITHYQVLCYLKSYSDDYNLRQYMQFNTLVENITPVVYNKKTNSTKYVIEVKHLKSNVSSKTMCDAVMICTGHLYQPNIPKIPGIETFKGKVLHSHAYRQPEDFAGETVVILGASSSGTDIAIDLSSHVKQIYLSHNRAKLRSPFPENIEQVSGVLKTVNNTLILRDGTNITADAFIFCTGYANYFPFLNKKNGIIVEKHYVHPLYKHMVNVNYPTMGIIGLPLTVSFINLYVQAKYFVALLQGKVVLPDKEIMLKDSELNDKKKNNAHELTETQWAYYDELAAAADFKPLPKFYENSYRLWKQHFSSDNNLMTFKDYNLRVDEYGGIKLYHFNSTCQRVHSVIF